MKSKGNSERERVILIKFSLIGVQNLRLPPGGRGGIGSIWTM